MSEVKSLKVTDSTYRHRGWLWKDRGVYERFKSHMKLPLWIDRILTDSDDMGLYAVGKTDGLGNTVFLGPICHAPLSVPESFPERAAFHNCRIHPNNGFRVLAERIRAKKPDANKAARPQWRRRIAKPWEPGVLGGNWVVDSKFVKEVNLNTPTPPDWADRLWVSTSGDSDTFVWVNSKSYGTVDGKEQHRAKGAVGIIGSQKSTSGFEYDSVLTHGSCHWQLAGVRKKTVQVPLGMVVKAPVVIKPESDVSLTATAVRASQDELSYYGTDSGRVPHLNPLLAAPYGADPYSKVAQELAIAHNKAKVRSFRSMFNPPLSFLNLDLSEIEAKVAFLYGSLGSRPPIGVKPRNLHDEERANALDEAMVRYLNEGLPFPIEWATEWNELRARLNKEQK